MPSSNRLNLEIQQNLSSFVERLPADSGLQSKWSTFLEAASKVQATNIQGVKMKLEEETLLVVAIFDTNYNLKPLIDSSRSGMLKTAAPLTPSLQTIKLLLGVTLQAGHDSPFAQKVDSAIEKQAWQIILGALNALARTGKPDAMALAGVPRNDIVQLGEKELFDYCATSPDQFLNGLSNGNAIKDYLGDTIVFRHQMRIFNNQLRQSFGATLALR